MFDVALMTPEHMLRIRQYGDQYMPPTQIEAPEGGEFTPQYLRARFHRRVDRRPGHGLPHRGRGGVQGPKSWADFWDVERQAAYTAVLACGPPNMKAHDVIIEEKAAVLPTTLEHISGLALLGADHWAESQDALTQRFEQWILI